MRTIFLVLLFVNVAFFAYRAYIVPYAGREVRPSAQQINPERVRVYSTADFERIVAARRGAACIELGPFATGDAPRVEQAVTALGGGLKVSTRRADEPSRWWVYIPPLATRQAALQREAELKKQGVDDSTVINDDPNFRYAISLGVFRTEEAANNRADALRRRGVQGMAVGPRDGPGPRVYVQLRESPEPVRMKLFDLKARFPGSEVRECQSS